mmetsp:Transcript_2085/g.13454  ORF Transcript_2085/g.13454 Transcript_2085/m.13454 type:complete len:103 (-) Transcript_2085:168-476(-)
MRVLDDTAPSPVDVKRRCTTSHPSSSFGTKRWRWNALSDRTDVSAWSYQGVNTRTTYDRSGGMGFASQSTSRGHSTRSLGRATNSSYKLDKYTNGRTKVEII